MYTYVFINPVRSMYISVSAARPVDGDDANVSNEVHLLRWASAHEIRR
jgi:hypothetical protein